MEQELQLTLSTVSNHAKDEREDEPASKKRKKNKIERTSSARVLGTEYACLEALYAAWRVIPDQNAPAALKWATALRRLGEGEKAKEVILAAGGSRGRLKQEWEKAQEEGFWERSSPRVDEDRSTVSARMEQDIAIQDVEFA